MARVVEAGRVRAGERDLVVAKPTLKVSREIGEVLPKIAAFGGGQLADLRALQVRVILLLVGPAQPDLTADAMLEDVLEEEIDPLFSEALRVAGYHAKPPGEAARP